MLEGIRNSANGSEEYFRVREVRYLISVIDKYKEENENLKLYKDLYLGLTKIRNNDNVFRNTPL